MSPFESFRNPWVPVERRVQPDRRRARDRRTGPDPVPADRRADDRPRRSGLDRRESVAGHMRNALQVLLELTGSEPLEGEQQERLDSLSRRLWLALAEAQRLGSRPAPVSEPAQSAGAFR